MTQHRGIVSLSSWRTWLRFFQRKLDIHQATRRKSSFQQPVHSDRVEQEQCQIAQTPLSTQRVTVLSKDNGDGGEAVIHGWLPLVGNQLSKLYLSVTLSNWPKLVSGGVQTKNIKAGPVHTKCLHWMQRGCRGRARLGIRESTQKPLFSPCAFLTTTPWSFNVYSIPWTHLQPALFALPPLIWNLPLWTNTPCGTGGIIGWL